ncbi:MAG: hypothetical protein ACI8YQ_005012 [Polaribacter sp.]|jgi:hypothetical protein
MVRYLHILLDSSTKQYSQLIDITIFSLRIFNTPPSLKSFSYQIFKQMETINKLKNIALFLSLSLFSEAPVYGTNIVPIPIANLAATTIRPPSFIILDTLSQSNGASHKWIIQLRPDPFFDGIRIKPTIQKASFSWCLKTIDGFELAKRVVRHPEAKLNFTYLPAGTYVLELSSGSEVSSLLLAKY